jgi:hypothetical protein
MDCIECGCRIGLDAHKPDCQLGAEFAAARLAQPGVLVRQVLAAVQYFREATGEPFQRWEHDRPSALVSLLPGVVRVSEGELAVETLVMTGQDNALGKALVLACQVWQGQESYRRG